MRQDESGFTIPELIVTMTVSSVFAGLLIFFMFSYWRYGLLLEADQDTFTSRLNAGDYLRRNISPASAMIVQNSIPDDNPGSLDAATLPANYWTPIHAIPGPNTIGAAGTKKPVVYYKRPTITTTNTVAMNGVLPYEDEFILYMDGSTKTLMVRTLANASVPDNSLKTSCPPELATSTCPEDRTIAEDISGVTMRYFSKTGNLIDYTSSTDSLTGEYTGPDFSAVEVVEFTLNLTKKTQFQTSNSVFNSTTIRVALRS